MQWKLQPIFYLFFYMYLEMQFGLLTLRVPHTDDDSIARSTYPFCCGGSSRNHSSCSSGWLQRQLQESLILLLLLLRFGNFLITQKRRDRFCSPFRELLLLCYLPTLNVWSNLKPWFMLPFFNHFEHRIFHHGMYLTITRKLPGAFLSSFRIMIINVLDICSECLAEFEVAA